MRIALLALLLASAALFAAGCDTGADSAAGAKEISNEIPKGNPNVPDMPEPPGAISRGEAPGGKK